MILHCSVKLAGDRADELSKIPYARQQYAPDSVYEITQERTEYCCDDAREMDKELEGAFAIDEKSREPVAKLHFRTPSWGEIDHDYYPIQFCPFCGVAVSVAIDKTERFVRQVITKQRPKTEIVGYEEVTEVRYGLVGESQS